MNVLSIVMPVYNERNEIGGALIRIEEIMRKEKYINECIVVDDGSQDGSGDVIKRHSVKYYRSDENRGYGASIKKGVAIAANDMICIIDGDDTYDPNDILRLYEQADQCDVVIGARPHRIFPIHQRIAKRFVRCCLKIFFGLKIEDINSGLILFKRDLFDDCKENLSDSFSFSGGITLASSLAGFKVKFVPISYKFRKTNSKVNIAKYVLTFIKSYSKVLFNIRQKNRD